MQINPRKNSVLTLFGVSFVGAFIAAIVYLAVVTYTLPKSDMAYGQSMFQNIKDPFVLTIMAVYIGIAGILAFVFAIIFLRTVDLFRSTFLILGAVIAEIIVVTPFFGITGIFGALVIMLGCMAICRRIYV